MSSADAPGPRRFCQHCLDHLQLAPVARTEGTPNGQVPFSCNFEHLGAGNGAQLSYFTYLDGRVRVEDISVRPRRLGLAGVGSSGRHRIDLVDASGVVLQSHAFNVDFGAPGPKYYGVDYSGYAADRVFSVTRLPLAEGVNETTQIRVHAFLDDVFASQTTVGGSPPSADAGSDLVAECVDGYGDVLVDASGSGDPDGDTLFYEWSTPEGLFDVPETAVLSLPVGSNELSLTVSDGLLQSEPDALIAFVEDSAAPTIAAEPTYVEVCDPGAQWVSLPLPLVEDACDSSPELTGEVVAIDGSILAVPIPLEDGMAEVPDGELTVRWTAVDGSGNSTIVEQTVHVMVRPVLQTAELLDIGDTTITLTSSGGSAAVLSRMGPLVVGAHAQVGDTTSGGGVWLRDQATVNGDLRLAGGLEQQNGIEVFGSTFTEPLPPLAPPPELPLYVAGGNPVMLDGTAAQAIAPGSYDAVILHSSTRLVLEPGDYFMRRLEVEPDSTVELNGDARIWVLEQLMWRGRLVRNGAWLTVGQYGSSSAVVSARVSTTIVIPDAELILESNHPAQFEGEIYAKVLRVPPNMTVYHATQECP